VGFQGEIIGKKAAGGKVGYGTIKKALADNGIELSSPKEIKDEVLDNSDDPKFKKKFKNLWKSTPKLEAGEDFEQYYDNPKKTLNQNLSYRISKYLGSRSNKWY
jgi:predicted nucleic acid-binding protein